MEPNKLENEFRKKLNERSLAPSANSWDRLDAMLTVAEEKKPKRNYGWMYIAASLAGFLLIGTVFFSQTEEIIDVRRKEVVTTDKETIQSLKEDITREKDGIVPTVKPSEAIIAVSEIKNKPSSNLKSTIVENNQNTNNQIAQTIDPLKNENALNEKTEKLLTNEDNALAVTNEAAKPSIKVDARKLLLQVDGELELTFREKIINKLDKNYKTVKVALTNRNQE